MTPIASLPKMTEYTSTVDLPTVASLLRNADGPIVIFTHAKPDGDAFGSVIATTAALSAIGKDVTACFVPPVPVSLSALRGSELAIVYDENTQLPDAAYYMVLDTGAWSQLGPVRDVVHENLEKTIVIDHHLSGDVPAKYRCIDGQAAACCEIVADLVNLLIDDLGCEKPNSPSAICDALFVGIASDTGWFRFSNTRPQTHRLAAELLQRGVNQSELYQKLEQTERPEKLALLIRALDSLKLIAGGKAAIMVLRGADFDETGALEEETERLIDIPQQVGTIRAIVLVSETQMQLEGDGTEPLTRMSFRSKPGDSAVNVAELAAQFGGGGHARAAGAKVQAPLAEVLPRIEAALAEAVQNTGVN